MAEQKIYALKGNVALRPVGSTGVYDDTLNATDAKISIAIETVKQKSNGDEPGTIAENEVSREATFEVTLQSRHLANLKRFYAADSIDVTASTAPVAFTLPAGPAGSIVNLGKSDITSTSFGTLVKDVDYTLKPKSGAIKYLTDITETVGTFEHGDFAHLGLISAPTSELEVFYTSENGGTAIELFRWKPSPSQVMQLISDGPSYGTSTLTGVLLIKEGVVADSALGRVGRIRALR